MAIVINDHPGVYYSAHGDLLFVVYESVKSNDPINYPDYKYVADIYNEGLLVARIKKAPQPDSKRGVFDIGAIVRSYINNPFNPTASSFLAQETHTGYFASVQVKFGEEYDNVIYTNLTVDDIRFYTDFYNGRLIGSRSALLPLFGKVISNRPYRNYVFNTGRCFLPIVADGTPLDIEVKTYNSNSLVDTQATTKPVTTSLQVYDVSPSGVNVQFPGLINSFVEYYTVKLGATSIYRFDLVCEPKYTVYNLHFKNQYGGFESKAFSKVSRKRIEVEKKSFGKLPYTVDGSGLINYWNSNNVYNEQKSVYSSRFTEPWTLNTDILSDEEYTWLQDLIISPEVYLEDSGYYLPVNVLANNYDKRKQINDKLTNLTLEIEFGETYNTQFR